MNIKILPLANEDLLNGYYFYEQQKEGLGHYFLDSLFSDIDSLLIYAVLDCRNEPAWIKGRFK
jgi:hypothetical protein